MQLAVLLESDAKHIIKRSVVPQAFRNSQHALLTLCAYDDVDVRRLECLCWQQRRMPAAKDDRELRIPPLDRLRYIHCLADHWPRYQGNSQAQRVLYLLKNALLIVRFDGCVDDPNLVTGFQ